MQPKENDEITLVRAAKAQLIGDGSTTVISRGTKGTVLFVYTAPPEKLVYEVEFFSPTGYALATVDASFISHFSINMSASTRSIAQKNDVRVESPIWTNVEQWIFSAYESGGSVSFDLVKERAAGSLASCMMRAEPHQFLYMASIYDEKFNRTVCWQDPIGTPPRGQIYIAGDAWDARWIQTDIVIALTAFKEVFETGELSNELLKHMR